MVYLEILFGTCFSSCWTTLGPCSLPQSDCLLRAPVDVKEAKPSRRLVRTQFPRSNAAHLQMQSIYCASAAASWIMHRRLLIVTLPAALSNFAFGFTRGHLACTWLRPTAWACAPLPAAAECPVSVLYILDDVDHDSVHRSRATLLPSHAHPVTSDQPIRSALFTKCSGARRLHPDNSFGAANIFEQG